MIGSKGIRRTVASAFVAFFAAAALGAGPAGRAFAESLGRACPAMPADEAHGCCGELPPPPTSDCSTAPCYRLSAAPPAAVSAGAPRVPAVAWTLAARVAVAPPRPEPTARAHAVRPAHPPDVPLFLLSAAFLN